MFIPKKYGHGKVDRCPFCQKMATAMNSQSVPVCNSHKEHALDGLKCACGSSLEMLQGRYGGFFSCVKCGNVGLKRALELNPIKPKITSNYESNSGIKREPEGRKEITVRSDDPRYFD